MAPGQALSGLPLRGVRVLECGDTIATAYAGRILTDLGADVVVVEAVDGHPLRRIGPLLPSGDERERSASFACFAAGKRSIALDVRAPDAGRRLALLAASADVVLRSTVDGTDWLGDAELDAVCAQHPHLVVADVSTFGRVGQPAPHPTSDLLALAAGGLLSVNSTQPGDPDGTPLRYRGELSMVHSGAAGGLAIVGALMDRARTGAGQHIDVSAQAVTMSIMATAFPTFTYTGLVASHEGRRGVEPWGFFRCRDGMVLLQVTEDRQWVALGKILGDPEWAALEIFATTAERIEASDALDLFLEPAIAEWDAADFLAACHEGGVAAARIHTAADLLHWEHAVARQSYRGVTVDAGGGSAPLDVLVPVPGWRYRFSEAPDGWCAPRLGSSGDGTAPVWPEHESLPLRTAPTNDGPLSGVRVVDLTWVWAGPYAAMQLAHLGAEVVKVESSSRLDVTRQLGPWLDGEPGPNRSGYFNQYNLGKQGMLLDLKSERGLQVLRDLLLQADVVIDNMSVGALDRLGFSYDELRRLNPRIVAVSMTGFGETGPESDRMAYGSLIDAMSGVASSNGPPGGGPTDFVMSLPDPTAGVHAAIATVAALLRARATGIGERVECSMLEASVAAFPWPILYQGLTGDGPPVEGNRDERRAPHDVYRCIGDYQWVAVSVEDDAQFAGLCRAIGSPELAHDDRYATLAARREHADSLDDLIGAWTNRMHAEDAANALRSRGVPAEAVLHIDGAYADERQRARHLFVELPHPEVGDRPLCGPPWQASRSRMSATTGAPCLGQHTRSVLGSWLGLSSTEIDGLADAGVLR